VNSEAAVIWKTKLQKPIQGKKVTNTHYLYYALCWMLCKKLLFKTLRTLEKAAGSGPLLSSVLRQTYKRFFFPSSLPPSFLPSFLSFFLAVLGRWLFIKIMYLNKIPRIPSTWPVDLAILLVLAKSVTVNSEKIIPPL
jgi:hypothetical protein